jgi:hypothetical protein
MTRGCNDCMVRPGRLPFLTSVRGTKCAPSQSGSAAPTMARHRQTVGVIRQSRRFDESPAALL